MWGLRNTNRKAGTEVGLDWNLRDSTQYLLCHCCVTLGRLVILESCVLSQDRRREVAITICPRRGSMGSLSAYSFKPQIHWGQKQVWTWRIKKPVHTEGCSEDQARKNSIRYLQVIRCCGTQKSSSEVHSLISSNHHSARNHPLFERFTIFMAKNFSFLEMFKFCSNLLKRVLLLT